MLDLKLGESVSFDPPLYALGLRRYRPHRIPGLAFTKGQVISVIGTAYKLEGESGGESYQFYLFPHLRSSDSIVRL